jgi:hypothetical protein
MSGVGVLLAATGQGVGLDGVGDRFPAHLAGPVGPVIESSQGVGHVAEVRLEYRQLTQVSVGIEHPTTVPDPDAGTEFGDGNVRP